MSDTIQEPHMPQDSEDEAFEQLNAILQARQRDETANDETANMDKRRQEIEDAIYAQFEPGFVQKIRQ